jgi:hypothetical protein
MPIPDQDDSGVVQAVSGDEFHVVDQAVTEEPTSTFKPRPLAIGAPFKALLVNCHVQILLESADMATPFGSRVDIDQVQDTNSPQWREML